MASVELTEAASAAIAAIAARIDAFDSESDRFHLWHSPFVHKFDALPLYIGWTECVGIRPDGAIVSWSIEGEYEGAPEVEYQLLVRIALVSGAKRYSFLQPFIPERPPYALDCRTCNGSGTIERLPNVICECGGIGWVDPPQ